MYVTVCVTENRQTRKKGISQKPLPMVLDNWYTYEKHAHFVRIYFFLTLESCKMTGKLELKTGWQGRSLLSP